MANSTPQKNFMSQRTQISRTECPKQTLQSPNTAHIRTFIPKGTQLFSEVTPALPKSQTSPSPLLKGPTPATGVIQLALKHQLEHSNFTLQTVTRNRNQPRHPPVHPCAAGKRLKRCYTNHSDKNCKKPSSATHPRSWMSNNSLSFAPIHLFSHISSTT